jgi:hypothetical protein
LKSRIQEAEYLLQIAETKRSVYMAEENLMKYRIQEWTIRTHLYRLLVCRMQEKISGADLTVGQARLDLQDAHTAYFELSRKFPNSEDPRSTKRHLGQFEGANRPKRRSHMYFSELCSPFGTLAQVLMSR